MTLQMDEPIYGCEVKELPPNLQMHAARTAIEINPANRPEAPSALLVNGLITPAREVMTPGFLALLTSKYWGAGGVKLGVSFMESTPSDLRDRIISHMNAWNQYCNSQFAWSQSQGQVRISRGQGGYYSYLGTDILHIPIGQQTMNLQGFTMQTAESEYHRVVRHETGHTLGFPHEHMRREIIQRLDRQKTIAYFQQNQGWDQATTIAQVLTPLEEASLIGISSPHADETSIMTYSLPGSITTDGRPIVGGSDIDPIDQEYAGKMYPLAVQPPTPPAPPPNPPGPVNPTNPIVTIGPALIKLIKLLCPLAGGLSAPYNTLASIICGLVPNSQFVVEGSSMTLQLPTWMPGLLKFLCTLAPILQQSQPQLAGIVTALCSLLPPQAMAEDNDPVTLTLIENVKQQLVYAYPTKAPCGGCK